MQSNLSPSEDCICICIHAHRHTEIHTHSHTINMLTSCHQEESSKQQREVWEWSNWCLLKSSWQRQNATMWSAGSLQENKTKKKSNNWWTGWKKKEGGYGANRAIPTHTYLFDFSRHCQVFSAPQQMRNKMRLSVRRLFLWLCWFLSFFFLSLSLLFLPPLKHVRQFKQEQPSFLPAPTNTRPLLLSRSPPSPTLSLSRSLYLPLYSLFKHTLDAPCTHLLNTDAPRPPAPHSCTPPVMCARCS